MGRSSDWRMGVGGRPSINSKQMHKTINSKRTILRANTLEKEHNGGKTCVKSRGMYSRKGFCKKMLASGPAGIMGNEPTEGNGEQFPHESRRIAERVRRPITNDGLHLAARHRDWESEGVGEAIYMYTLWIMRWEGNDFTGSKINRRPQVAAELDIPM